jgi:hypothetical protein
VRVTLCSAFIDPPNRQHLFPGDGIHHGSRHCLALQWPSGHYLSVCRATVSPEPSPWLMQEQQRVLRKGWLVETFLQDSPLLLNIGFDYTLCRPILASAL